MQKYMYIFALLIFAAIGFNACTDTTDLENQIAELQKEQAEMQNELSNTVDMDAITKAIQDALKGDGNNSDAIKELQAQIKAIAESLPEDTDLADAISTLETQLASKLSSDDKTELSAQITSLINALGYAGVDNGYFNDGKENGYAYIDLALPSGTLWATCNIGATSPEDFGNYYAWGELEGCDRGDENGENPEGEKTEFSWATYKFCDNDEKDGKSFSKYKGEDNEKDENGNIDLALEDDIAAHLWKGNWRMPSKADIDELQKECNIEWITKNGVKGRLFTSKKNGHSIFMPSTGYRQGNLLKSQGSNGYYWSRSLSASKVSQAYCLFVFVQYDGSGYLDRYYGRSVRAVCDPETK